LWLKLEKHGINRNSKFLNALKSLYKDVKCSVRLQGHYSEWFDVNVGLKQGCLLSCTLFNMYINDLASNINSLNKGINIHNEKVSLLMYADDLVLMAESGSDLQCMLDQLNTWCLTWNVKINEQKSKVMHCRSSSNPITKQVFHCGDKCLEMCSKYKYLGMVIDEHLDFSVMAKQVAQSAHRALGLLIAKDKAQGGFTFDIYTSLYNSMVSSIIDYGSAIWGHISFSCIEAVQNRASRYFLGLGSHAPNRAVQGDVGWKLQEDRQMKCVINQWLRMCNMKNDKLCKKVFSWCVMKASLGVKSRYAKTLHFLNQNGFQSLCNVNNNTNFNDIKDELDDVLYGISNEKWLTDVNVLYSKTGEGKNKLRTYKHFKNKVETEHYVLLNIRKKYRRALSMFRAGVAPINIELLRYGVNKKTEEERFCIFCNNTIETECHVLIKCPVYDDIRNELYNNIPDLSFFNINDEHKLYYLLSKKDIVYNVARACFYILDRRKILTYI